MLEQYEIQKKLAEGNSGTVYLAKQQLVDRLVAIKFLNSSIAKDETASKRFYREAKILSALDHPHIAKVLANGISHDDLPFLVLEYAEGPTLEEKLKTEGALKAQDFTAIFIQICDALSYAHSEGVIHRDLKPGNVILKGNQPFDVKLLDFGIAKRISAQHATTTLTIAGAGAGTPNYMSPEQCRGEECDARADIYALGCMMYECLSGHCPFHGDSPAAVMMAHINDAAPKLESLPERINIQQSIVKLVNACLQKDKLKRPQSVAEIQRIFIEAEKEEPQLVGGGSSKVSAGIALKTTVIVVIAILTIAAVPILKKNLELAQKAEQNRIQEQNFQSALALVDDATEKFRHKDKPSYGQIIVHLRKAIERLDSLPSEKRSSKKVQRAYSEAYNDLAAAYYFLKSPTALYSENMQEAISHAESAYGIDSERTLELYYNLADTLASLKRDLRQAEKAVETLVKERSKLNAAAEKQITKDDADLLSNAHESFVARRKLGDAMALEAQVQNELHGASAEVARRFEVALDLQSTDGGDKDQTTIKTMGLLCQVYHDLNMGAKEDRILSEYLERLENATNLFGPGRIQELESVESFYERRNDYKRASQVMTLIVMLSEQIFGSRTREYESALSKQKELKSKKYQH